MQWLDKQRLKSETLAGTFLNLGNPAAVEIAAGAGFDWLLLDCEHGSGSVPNLRPQLLACSAFPVAPIVRIRSVDPDTVKFVMDSGAAGIMFPFVSTPEQAELAVRCMKYPPRGNRGVAGIIRATAYGSDWAGYFAEANERGLVVVQIETPEAVAAADEIAAVEGVDVLFVGPLDLSVNMGVAGDFSAADFRLALKEVVAACERHGKTAGILSKAGFEQEHLEMGFRFFALGSDAAAIAAGMGEYVAKIRR